MPTILTPNTVMVEMIYNLHGTRVENVYHVRCPAAPTLADLPAIRTIFVKAWRDTPIQASNIAQHVSNQVQLYAVIVRSLHSVGAPIHEYVPPVALNGNVAANALPSHIGAVIRWVTAQSGRNYKGRTYHIGTLFNQTGSDGLIVPTHQTNLITAYTALLNAVTAGGYTLVVASKYSGTHIVNGYRRGIPRAVGITTAITGCTVDRRMAHIDKRKLPAST